MQVLSPDFSRYLSHSFTIPSHAQGHNDAHGACAAGLPGICDVNLVSHTMGDDKSPSARSRGICKPEKPTKVHLPAHSAPRLRRNPPTARKTHRSFNDGRVPYNGQAGAAIGCSVSATVFSHWTVHGRPPSARMVFSLFCRQHHFSSFGKDSLVKKTVLENSET